MLQRTIDWLKQQQLNKRFLVCKESDRAHVADPDFEDWIIVDSQKHVSTWWGDGWEADDDGFSFCNQAPPSTCPDNPFPFIQPVYARYRCEWKYVTAIFQGSSGRVYIFTGEQQQNAAS